MSHPIVLDDKDVNYSLICAVRTGDLEKTRQLINSYGLSHSRAWCGGYVLLRNALRFSQRKIAKLLLRSGAEVNRKKEYPTNTPLHFSAKNCDAEIVKMILDRGAEVNVRNDYRSTPLHEAVAYNKIEIVELLLKYGADVDVKDNICASPLYIAIKKEYIQIIELLLQYGADVNNMCSIIMETNHSLLHFAVEKNSKHIVTLLLGKGANSNVKGEDDITPLHIAGRVGNIFIIQDLLNHGACVQSMTLTQRYTPLHFACEEGKEEAVKLFLNNEADKNARTIHNLTPLHIAVRKGHEKVVKLLYEYKAKVDYEDENKILEYCFNFNKEDINDSGLLHAAVENGYLKIVENLLKCGADVNNKFNEGFTLLHTATKHKRDEVAKLLISYRADINAKDKMGKTPLFYAIKNADLRMTKLLLKSKANVKDNADLLHAAVQKPSLEIVKLLLEHDADVNATDENGRTALFFSTIDNFPNEVDSDIKLNIAKLLLSRGAKTDIKINWGESILCAAINNGFSKVVELFLEFIPNVNFNQENDIPLLHLSVKNFHKEICLMLLNKGANVNDKQTDGKTALHIAAECGDKQLVNLLLEHGAEVNSKTECGVTPLHLASYDYNGVEIIDSLLNFGAYIDSRDAYGKTALHVAFENGNVEIINTLLKNGSDINITTKDGKTYFDFLLLDYSDDGMYDLLEFHVIKLKSANLYVSEENLRSLRVGDEINDFRDKCEQEIAMMKSDRINNQNISFYDILSKDISSLVIYMRNENILDVLKSGAHKTKYSIYGEMIENHFVKIMKRKELIEQVICLNYQISILRNDLAMSNEDL